MHKTLLKKKKLPVPQGKKKRTANKRKGVIPKGASMNQTKGPMQGAAQIEDIVKKKATKLHDYICIYEYLKEKLCAL